jgi:hypothetical protein
MSYDDQYIAGTAYHCHNGDASAQTALHNAYPSKDIWFIECTGFHGPTDAFAKYFPDTLNWHAQNIELGTTKNWAGGTSTDTTPPTVPANVAASGMTSSSTNLTWTASTDNVDVTGYTVSRNSSVIGTPASAWSGTVQGGSGATGNGTRVQLWSYAGGTNQQWQPVRLGGGLDKFVALNSGKCLDLRDLNIADGAWMQQWTCTGGPAQSFRLVQQP